MTIVFITQISSAIYAFQLIGKSESNARYSIDRLMESYIYGGSEQMDWIQRNVRKCEQLFFVIVHLLIEILKKNQFQCCGNDGPSDWNHYSKFERPSSTYNSYNYYYQSTTTTTTLSTPLPDRMPASCCVDGSNYNDLTCDKHYQLGCRIHVREVISSTVMIVGSVALAIAVFEV